MYCFILSYISHMKKNTFSLLKSSALVLTLVLMWIFSSKTFAYNYTGNFTPALCDASIMTAHIVPSTFSWWDIYTHSIYVFSGDYTITSNITIDDCSVIVVDAASTWAKLTFQNGSYISSNTQDNIIIRGFNATHRLELVNGNNSPGWIILQNNTNVKILNTTVSGFMVNGWIRLYNTNNSFVTNNIIYNNKHGVRISWASTGNTISDNDIYNNTDKGIWIWTNSNSNIISDNNIFSNTNYWIHLEWANSCTISNNTITGQSAWIWLQFSLNTNENNIVTSNNISGNFIWVSIDGAKSNNFSYNTISNNNGWWLKLYNGATGNIFTSDIFSTNTGNNIILSTAHSNQFINITTQNSPKGINLTNSNYNIFNWTIVTGNTEGVILTTSSYNTITLSNNNNGIALYVWSNNNNIYNDQPTNNPLNNITISNGADNTITWGLFTNISTTSTSVYVNFLQNAYAPMTYSITGNGLSGIYENIDMTWLTWAIIEFLAGTNGLKNIEVTYNNNNKQYDSITLWTVVTPPSWGGGWGWGWGGGIAMCTASQLVCSNNIRVLASWATCQSASLGKVCNLSGSTAIGSIVGSKFSTELNNAYLRGFANGITTMNTIQKANMTWSLIRSHMAKMISNFAISLGWLTPNTGASCTFSDIANQSTEMKFYIKLACQLGLMGQDISKFDPSSVVTRAQFGTILSRVIWGNRYEWGVKYYTNHLAALKNVGIMTKIENPTEKEIRGYVMIMMKRTYDWGYLD